MAVGLPLILQFDGETHASGCALVCVGYEAPNVNVGTLKEEETILKEGKFEKRGRDECVPAQPSKSLQNFGTGNIKVNLFTSPRQPEVGNEHNGLERNGMP